MALVKTHLGWIEVICGSMFSGKSEELIRRLRRAIIAKQRVQIFKPVVDSRYSDEAIVSHSEMRLPSISVADSEELFRKVDHRTEVVGIDEAQFFDDGIVAVCERLADQGKRVVVAGLDKDYRGAPFGPIPRLMAVAEDVTKTLAICVRCGAPANNTQRLVESDELVVVGAQGVYEARCRRCYEPPERKN
jgi:thymidine kinase